MRGIGPLTPIDTNQFAFLLSCNFCHILRDDCTYFHLYPFTARKATELVDKLVLSDVLPYLQNSTFLQYCTESSKISLLSTPLLTYDLELSLGQGKKSGVCFGGQIIISYCFMEETVKFYQTLAKLSQFYSLTMDQSQQVRSCVS